MTAAPASANDWAIPRPMPRDPPVTTPTLPSNVSSTAAQRRRATVAVRRRRCCRQGPAAVREPLDRHPHAERELPCGAGQRQDPSGARDLIDVSEEDGQEGSEQE